MAASTTAASASQTGTIAQPPSAASDFPPFDTSYWTPQIIWLAILFGALYLVMARIALPRVGSILSTRRGRIESDLGAADDSRRQAEAQKLAYEQLLTQARARAQSQGQETHQRLAAETEARRKTLEAQLAEKLAAAERQISETKSRAMSNVSSIAREAAQAIVERLLGRPADPITFERAFTKEEA